ncbi:Sodium/hydrogen exchanger 3 [Trichinella pseudospiralis]|uniref:Sodium/hydrogen exchanger n=1 Tax=Trichinella pseudospiralis TaxID=6337 RepID=A0A0V1DYA5_TRIPS|nr:Sodium/hydrogen exchanger 3 [Trichinella pseudospiralis]
MKKFFQINASTSSWIVCSFVMLFNLVKSQELLLQQNKLQKATGNETDLRYNVAKFDWHHVQTPFTIALWILLASVAKVAFQLSQKLVSIFPDSSLLIILGVVVGMVLYFFRTDERSFHMDSETFFLFLLPPIVFEAGYFMPNRAFFDNLGTILCYAVLGTIWNSLTIGLSLYAVSLTGLFCVSTPLLHVMLFASLISAVDPIAVLVVFEEIHINQILYIIVFGESLLNDAVSVVLYNIFKSYSQIGEGNIIALDIISGLVSFFVVGFGGVVIGFIWAVLISLITKWTSHVPILEPLFVFAMAYSAYLSAEMFHLSGILAIVFCGISMKQYVEGNISEKSQTTVQYFLKMLSSSSETVIFMFLGLSTVSTYHQWDTAFIALTIFFCLVYRTIGVVLQTFFINKFRIEKLNTVDQFIMAYGGLRGAIAYGLVTALDEKLIPAKQIFVTTTIVVIFFTVFLQGMTIKPLVNFLKVKRQEKRDKTLHEQMTDRLLDHICSGIEDICGLRGHHSIRDKYEYYNTKYLKPLLMRDAPKTVNAEIVDLFTQINLKEAMDHWARFGNFALPSDGSLSALIRNYSLQNATDFSNEQNADAKPVLDMNIFENQSNKMVEHQSNHHRTLHEKLHRYCYKDKTNVEATLSVEENKEITHEENLPVRSLRNTPSKPIISYKYENDVNHSKKRVAFYEKSNNDSTDSLTSYFSCGRQGPKKGGITITEKELPWKSSNNDLLPVVDETARDDNDDRIGTVASSKINQSINFNQVPRISPMPSVPARRWNLNSVEEETKIDERT